MIGIVVLALIVGGSLITLDLNNNRPIISGYDGLVAEITDIDSPYTSPPMTINQTYATIDPPWLGGLSPDPCGLKMEMDGSVDVHGVGEVLKDFNQVINHTDGSKTIIRRLVQIMNCSMGVTVTTIHYGMSEINNVVFTIVLTENDFSFFTDANETYAYILEVYTRSPADLYGYITVIPEVAKYPFPLTTIERSTVPSWLSDIGYNADNLARRSKVSFEIQVSSAHPIGISDTWGWTASTATFDIGIDVFLAGNWEKYVAKGWEPQPDPAPWWQGIVDFFVGIGAAVGAALSGLGDLLVPVVIIVVVVVVGFVIIKFSGRR
jgi:hypothetical protein